MRMPCAARRRWARCLCAFASLWLIFLAAGAQAEEGFIDLLRIKRPPPENAQPATPAPKSMTTTTIAGITVSVWMPPDSVKRPLPAILFSHGYRGCNTQSSFLMRALAADGYVVLAPNHHDASCGKLGGPKPEERFIRPNDWSAKTYEDRKNDMVAVLDAVRQQVPWTNLVDGKKIGLVGHSLGGYTVLGLAGGWEGWKLPDIKAVLALSPYCEPFIRHGALDRVTAAVMLQGGSLDLGITPSLRRPGGCYDKTPAPVYFVELHDAGHLAWTDLNAVFQDTITHYALGFLDAYVKGGKPDGLRDKYGAATEVRTK